MNSVTRPHFELDRSGDWFIGAQRQPSPNCSDRPAGVDIDLAVVHGISLPPGQFGGGQVAKLFLNKLDCDEHEYFMTIKELKVSSHLLVERCGKVHQFVPLSRRAWHAGISHFDGRQQCNDFSIGIELEGTDHVPYTASQYLALAQLLKTLMQRFPLITPKRIVGHCHIASDRKTDPGASFRWSCLGALIGAPIGWQPSSQGPNIQQAND